MLLTGMWKARFSTYPLVWATVCFTTPRVLGCDPHDDHVVIGSWGFQKPCVISTVYPTMSNCIYRHFATHSAKSCTIHLDDPPFWGCTEYCCWTVSTKKWCHQHPLVLLWNRFHAASGYHTGHHPNVTTHLILWVSNDPSDKSNLPYCRLDSL